MKDAVNLIYTELSGNTELMTLLGGETTSGKQKWKRIYDKPVAPFTNELPRITMFEVLNSDEVFADDVPHFSDVNVRIDVWTDKHSDIQKISKKVKEVLFTKFEACRIQLEGTLYEQDTKIYHKPINVFLLLEQEDDLDE